MIGHPAQRAIIRLHSQRGRYDPRTGFPLAQVSPKVHPHASQNGRGSFAMSPENRAAATVAQVVPPPQRSHLDSTSLNDMNLLFTKDWESYLMKGIFWEPEPLVLVPSAQIQNTASREETHKTRGR